MEFGHRTLQAVNQIYSTQQTQLLINGELTDTILICIGMRQGCPLSPLPFILSLEILLNQIRQHSNIKSLKMKVFNINFKVLWMI